MAKKGNNSSRNVAFLGKFVRMPYFAKKGLGFWAKHMGGFFDFLNFNFGIFKKFCF